MSPALPAWVIIRGGWYAAPEAACRFSRAGLGAARLRRVGLGRDGKPDLWLYPGTPPTDDVHVALAADDRAAVHGFHAAALAAGA